MAITLNGVEVLLTPETGGKGSSYVQGYSFEDISDAAIAGGWAGYRKLSNKNYLSEYTIRCEGVYFVDDSAVIEWNSIVGTTTCFYLNSTSKLYIGVETMSASNQRTGCVFKMHSTSVLHLFFYGETEIYNSVFTSNIRNGFSMNITGSSLFNIRFKNCQLVNSQNATIGTYTNVYLEDTTIINSDYGIRIQTTDFTSLNGLRADNKVAIMSSTQSTFKSYNIDCPTASFEIRSNSNIAPTIAELVDSNCIFKVRTNLTGSDVGSFAIGRLLSTFNLDIVDAGNANIKIYNKLNNEIYSGILDIDGITSTEILYYEKSQEKIDTNIFNNIEEYYHPFSVVVSKAGYEDLTIPDINIIAGQPTIIRGELVLTPAPPPPKPEITGVAIVQASSQTAADGQITIIAASGTQPYEYSLNGVDWQATGVFSGLAKGTYEVHVKDDNDLTDSIGGIEVPGGADTVYIDQTINASIIDIEDIHASLEIEESINAQMEEVMTITTDMQIG